MNTSNDSTLKRIHARIAAYRDREDARINALKVEIDKGWKAVGDLRYERAQMTNRIAAEEASLRHKQSKLRVRTGPLLEFSQKLTARQRVLREREEERIARIARRAAIKQWRLEHCIPKGGIKGKLSSIDTLPEPS